MYFTIFFTRFECFFSDSGNSHSEQEIQININNQEISKSNPIKTTLVSGGVLAKTTLETSGFSPKSNKSIFYDLNRYAQLIYPENDEVKLHSKRVEKM